MAHDHAQNESYEAFDDHTETPHGGSALTRGIEGAVIGVMAGPVGALAGAAIGGLTGAAGSGAAITGVEEDEENDTVSPGHGAMTRVDNRADSGMGTIDKDTGDAADRPVTTRSDPDVTRDVNADFGDEADDNLDLVTGNRVPRVQTGGRDVDGSPDTRGVMEKAADAVTGDHIDDKTGNRV